MINSIGIKNFRNLTDFQLKSLGRVNLITGKNNTGKSALLEAISIYLAKGDINWILSLLEERGENYTVINNSGRNQTETYLKTFSALFNGRTFSYFNENEKIEIGHLHKNGKISLSKFSLRIVKFTNEYIKKDDSDDYDLERRIVTNETENENKLRKISNVGLEICSGLFYSIINLTNPEDTDNIFPNELSENFKFIRTQNIESELNGELWDSIALSSKEEYVIKALKIIEPDVERITFINKKITSNGTEQQKQIPFIKLKNESDKIPLKSMGDGINRILTIILALANCDKGYLLIDEFENGLHYTVQEKLWEIIFTLAYDLNIQIFATTHSADCIASFGTILNGKEEYKDSKLIRLSLKGGIIKQVEYDAEDIDIATRQDIETR